MSEEKLQGLKAVELEILREFLRVCEVLGLNYFVIGGTLLGAVRHKGFIPWDDDIDVGMPREDYEKFLTNGQELLPGNLFLQTFETDPEYPANFAKIRNSNTTFVETSVRNCDINHGIYIDIFPLDYYPEKNVFWFEWKKLLLTLRISTVFGSTGMKRRTQIVRWLTRVLIPSHRNAVLKREKLFRSVKKSGLIANYCGAWGKREIVPAEWCSEHCELTFEGLAVRAPREYDKWLTQLYGDYMQFPPEEKRVAHHYADVIDVNTPYTEYRKKR